MQENILKIAVCEDNAKDREILEHILAEIKTPAKADIFSSGEALLEEYQSQKYDLVLMDIYMNGMTGVEAVNKIRKMDVNVPVAFITTSLEFTLEGYRLGVLRYIEKPLKKAAIEDIVKLALMQKNNAPALVLQRNGKDERLVFSNILYIEQHTHHLYFHCIDGTTEEFYKKLSEVLPALEDQEFFVPHKSYAVNLEYVRDINMELRCFILEDGSNVPIRRESMAEARKAMENHLFDRTRGQEV